MKVRIGYLQFSPIFGEKALNLKRVRAQLSKIKNSVVPTIISLPELFATGYSFSDRSELSLLAEEIPGETSEAILEIAREKNVAICGGLAEKKKDKFFNSAIFCLPDGRYYVYRKAHLFFKEKELFAPGDKPFSVFELPSGGEEIRIGVLICFDYFFPEAARTLVLKGAQIILHPANLILSIGPRIVVARAMENRVFWVLADRTGEERGLRFIGKSRIVTPEGKILASSNREEGLILAEIETKEAISKKVTLLNDILLDRREDLYFK